MHIQIIAVNLIVCLGAPFRQKLPHSGGSLIVIPSPVTDSSVFKELLHPGVSLTEFIDFEDAK
jgi:hypothetical protein